MNKKEIFRWITRQLPRDKPKKKEFIVSHTNTQKEQEKDLKRYREYKKQNGYISYGQWQKLKFFGKV